MVKIHEDDETTFFFEKHCQVHGWEALKTSSCCSRKNWAAAEATSQLKKNHEMRSQLSLVARKPPKCSKVRTLSVLTEINVILTTKNWKILDFDSNFEEYFVNSFLKSCVHEKTSDFNALLFTSFSVWGNNFKVRMILWFSTHFCKTFFRRQRDLYDFTVV